MLTRAYTPDQKVKTALKFRKITTFQWQKIKYIQLGMGNRLKFKNEREKHPHCNYF